MTYLDILRIQLRIDESETSLPYDDKTGKILKPGDIIAGNITIGIGRNLTVNGLNGEERTLCFENDLSQAVATARRLAPSFDTLDDVRKAVLVNMAFNLGHARLSKFKNMLQAVRDRDWDRAAAQMMESTWAWQTGSRAIRLANNMKNGVYNRAEV